MSPLEWHTQGLVYWLLLLLPASQLMSTEWDTVVDSVSKSCKNHFFFTCCLSQKAIHQGQVCGFKAWVRISVLPAVAKPEALLCGRYTSFSLRVLQLPDTLPCLSQTPTLLQQQPWAGPISHNVNGSSMQTSPDCYPTGVIAPSSLLPSHWALIIAAT